jgi:hypothetical protein
MKLTRWLFEEVEQTEQQRKLGVINDFVEDILNSSRLFVGTVIKQPDDESWILKTNFNNQPGIDLYLTYSYKWSEQINVFEINRNNKKYYKQYSSMKIKPELNTEDGSFQEWLRSYFKELLGMFESMFELQKELPQRHEEIIEFLRQQPNKFQLVGYSSSDKLVEFNIINNPNIHHTAIIGAKLSVSEADSRTRVRFIFQEEDGEELLGTIMLRKGESFEQGFLKDWPWIESQIEAMFVGDRD